MLTLKDYYRLLAENETLTWAELQDDPKRRRSDMKRLLELQLHRTVIKDCIIELLEKQIASQYETRKVA